MTRQVDLVWFDTVVASGSAALDLLWPVVVVLLAGLVVAEPGAQFCCSRVYRRWAYKKEREERGGGSLILPPSCSSPRGVGGWVARPD